jgi:hypothetical protein
MKKIKKKPTGKMEPLIVNSSGTNIAPNRFVFPDTKEEIELKITQLFLNLIQNGKSSPFPEKMTIVENKEYDLDFSLKAENYECLLELTEITPPGNMKGGFQDLVYSHNIGEHSDKIINLITKKSKKYVGIEKDIFLLMYISDDRSLPSPTTEKLVMTHLNNNEHKFKGIFVLFPIFENDGPIISYFPNKEKNLTEN